MASTSGETAPLLGGGSSSSNAATTSASDASAASKQPIHGKSKLSISVSAEDNLEPSASMAAAAAAGLADHPAGTVAEGSVNNGGETPMDAETMQKLVQAAKLRKWLLWTAVATVIVLIAILVAGIVLRRQIPRNYTSGCADNFDLRADYFPDKVELPPDAGIDFAVTYSMYYKTLINHIEDKQPRYVLYQCGTEKPRVDEGQQPPIAIPPFDVASELASTTHAIELLGRRWSLKLQADRDTITSPCLQQLIKDGTIGELRQNLDSVDLSFAAAEALFPDDVAVVVSAIEEESPEQAVEWLQYIGAAYNLEREALELVEGIRERYACRSASARAQAAAMGVQPAVAWLRYSTVQQAPGNVVPVWRHETTPWRDNLVSAAGGSPLLLPRPTYNNTADLHEIVLSQTDVLIELSPEITTWDQFLTIYQIEDNATFPFMQNQAVFKLDLRVNADGALEWDNYALFEPDVALTDMASAIYSPTNDQARRWLRRIAAQVNSTVLTAADCIDVNAPGLDPIGQPC